MVKTYIFDIDNTLCNTWPTLRVKKKSLVIHFFFECWRVSCIPSFNPMMKCVRLRKDRNDCEVYFLSARHWSLWLPTYIYLLRQLGLFNPTRLTLVPDANCKIRCFKECLLGIDGPLIVVDDLTYNTENGKTLYYSEVIRYLRKQKKLLKYVDKEKIDFINRM